MWDAARGGRRRRRRVAVAAAARRSAAEAALPARQGLHPGARRHRLHVGARRPPLPQAGDGACAAARRRRRWRRGRVGRRSRRATARLAVDLPAEAEAAPEPGRGPSSASCGSAPQDRVAGRAWPTPATWCRTGPRRGAATPSPLEQLVIDEELRGGEDPPRPPAGGGLGAAHDHRPRHRRRSRSAGSLPSLRGEIRGARCSPSPAPAATSPR